MQDVSHLVARRYEGHPYPQPIADLAEAAARGGYQVGDPSLWEPMLWPEGRPREDLRILVAGCGTSQAAWFAYANRACEVCGVDLSEPSLAHQRYLQERHGLANLRVFKGDLREAAEIGRDFDLVVCTGVLHHMADPDEGMRALAGVMAPHGALACMVYAAPHRAGVYMLQDVFRRLGVTADEEGIAFVRRMLAGLPPWHFALRYTSAAIELQHDTALVDTFLHPQDRGYTVPQLLALVEDNGLHFQGWFENSNYHPEGCRWLALDLAARITALPAREQWAAMEMLNIANYAHFFFARRQSAPALSFAGDAWKQLAPHAHPALRRLGPTEFARANVKFELAPSEAAVMDLVDGARTLREIAAAVSAPGERVSALFERLWKQGHLMLSGREF